MMTAAGRKSGPSSGSCARTQAIFTAMMLETSRQVTKIAVTAGKNTMMAHGRLRGICRSAHGGGCRAGDLSRAGGSFFMPGDHGDADPAAGPKGPGTSIQ